MEELGEAFIRVNADVSSFRDQLDREVKKALATAEKKIAKTPLGKGAGSAAQSKAAVKAQQAIEKASNKISDTYVRQGKEATNAARKVRDAFNDQFVEINKTGGALDKLRKVSAKAAAQQIKDNEKVQEAFSKLYRDVQSDALKAANARTAAAAKAAAQEIADNEKIQAAFNKLYADVQLDANRAAAARATAAAKAAAQEIKDTDRISAAFDKLYNEIQRDAAKAAAAREAAANKAAAAERRSLEQVRAAASRGFRTRDFFAGLSFPADRIQAQADGAAARIRKQFADVGRSIGNSLQQGVKIGLAGVALTAAAAGGGAAFFSVQQAANLEQARVQFANLAANLVGATRGTEEYAQAQANAARIGKDYADSLIEISNSTTFSLQGLRDTTTALLAIGQTGDQAKELVLNFADAAAAAGQSGTALDESVRGAVRAFTQIASKGKLAAQELNQISDQIPTIQRVELYRNLALRIQELSKMAGASTGLKKLAKDLGEVDKTGELTGKQLNVLRKQLESDEGVSSAIALPVLQQTLQEIEGASGALERQGDTLAGRIEALRDNLRTAFGKSFLESDAFQPLVDALDPDKLGPILEDTAAGFADAIGPALSDAIPKIVEALPGLAKSIGTIFAGLVKGFTTILPIAEKVFEFFANITNALQGERGDQFFKDIAPIIEVVKNAFQTFAKTLFVVGGIFAELVHQLAPLFKAFKVVADVAQFFANIILGIFSNELVQKVTAFVLSFLAVAGVFAKIGVAAAKIGQATGFVARFVSSLLGGGNAATKFGNQIAKFIVPFGRLPQLFNIVSKAVGLLAKPTQLIAALFVRLGQVASRIPVIGGPIAAVFGRIASVFTTVSGSINLLAGAIAALVGSFGGLLGKIPGVSAAMDALGGAARKVGGWFKSAVSGVKSFVGASSQGAAKAKVYSDRLAKLNAELAGLPNVTTIDVIVRYQQIGQINTEFLKSNGIDLTGLEDATGFSTEGIMAAGEQIKKQQAAIDKANKAALSSFGGGGSSGGGGGGGGASKKSEMRDRIRGILEGIKEELTTADSAKAVREAFAKLRKDLKEALDVKNLPDRLAAKLQKQNKRLQRLVEERSSIAKRLELANAAFEETFDATSSLGNIVDVFDSISEAAEGAANSVDLSRLRIIKPGQDALGGAVGGLATQVKSDTDRLATALQDRLKKLRDFNEDIRRLIERGASRSLVKQLIQGGPEAAGALADQLANSSDSALKGISDAQKAIDEQAKILAGFAADEAASIGENVSLGIVEGLKKRRKELAVEIEKLVANIIKTLRKQLGIKSPSKKVEDSVGKWIVPGITDRIAKDGHLVDSAVNSMGDKLSKANLNLAPIGLPELGQMARTEVEFGLKELTDQRGTQASFDKGASAIVDAIKGGYQAQASTRTIAPTPPPPPIGIPARRGSLGGFNTATIRGGRR